MRIPLFPLQSLLFPDGRLGLRIFEPRYLDMVKRCHERGEPFGVVALIDGGEVRQRASGSDDGGFVRERFQPVGTLAHIGLFDRPQPGLMQILCRGGQRFRLHSSECLAHGLWMGEAELINEDGAVQVPADLRPAARLLQGLLHRLELGAAAAELPIQPPYLWDDCGWLANRWCELLPLPAEEKQRLMQLENPLLRLELVADQLEGLGITPD